MGKGLAILGVPGVMGEHKRTLIITDFTQSLGAELLTNGDFSAWTGDNPTGWSVTESAPDPEITERGAGESHASDPAGSGMANIYRSEGQKTVNHWMTQAGKITAGYWYEIGLLVDTVAVGTVRIGGSSNQPPGYTTGAAYTGTVRSIGRGTVGSGGTMIIHLPVNTAGDITIDDATWKRITLNAQKTMPAANALVELLYTPPASPAAGDTISIFDRISDASLEAGYNCWQSSILRNTANSNWDFRLDSVSAGTVTNRISVTSIGNTVGFRHRANGTLHDCWTTANGVDWTKRGSQVNVSWNDAATGVNTVYSSQATPTKLTVTPL